jgi:hypothetical protein
MDWKVHRPLLRSRGEARRRPSFQLRRGAPLYGRPRSIAADASWTLRAPFCTDFMSAMQGVGGSVTEIIGVEQGAGTPHPTRTHRVTAIHLRSGLGSERSEETVWSGPQGSDYAVQTCASARGVPRARPRGSRVDRGCAAARRVRGRPAGRGRGANDRRRAF